MKLGNVWCDSLEPDPSIYAPDIFADSAEHEEAECRGIVAEVSESQQRFPAQSFKNCAKFVHPSCVNDGWVMAVDSGGVVLRQ